MAARLMLAAWALLVGFGAKADLTDPGSDAERQGRQMAQNIWQQQPSENFTNQGVLVIRESDGKRTEIPLTSRVLVTPTHWQTEYEATMTNRVEAFQVVHTPDQRDEYFYATNAGPLFFQAGHGSHPVSGPELTAPFAGSDFWLGDLALEFFHWPQQKVLRKEVHRSCGCTVLESTNPDPSAIGYVRVVSWIDTESLGIVEANAYDARGRLLKDFYPKNLKKVNGRYQVETLIMENIQTGSRTRLDFDLKP
jgi:hypothetical protein